VKTKHVYWLLAFAGVALPYSQLLPWIADNGLNVGLLVQQAIASRVAAFGWLDVIVSALVLLVLIFTEGRDRQVPWLWLPILGTLAVGVSSGLPLYLYLRG